MEGPLIFVCRDVRVMNTSLGVILRITSSSAPSWLHDLSQLLNLSELQFLLLWKQNIGNMFCIGLL